MHWWSTTQAIVRAKSLVWTFLGIIQKGIILVFSLFNIGFLVQLGQAVHLCQVVEESPGKDCILSSLTTSHWPTFISLNKENNYKRHIICPPNVRRHRRSHRNVGSNWVETKFVGHVFNAHLVIKMINDHHNYFNVWCCYVVLSRLTSLPSGLL